MWLLHFSSIFMFSLLNGLVYDEGGGSAFNVASDSNVKNNSQAYSFAKFFLSFLSLPYFPRTHISFVT